MPAAVVGLALVALWGCHSPKSPIATEADKANTILNEVSK